MTTPFEALAGLQVLIVEDEGLIAEELRERITHFGAIVADVVDTAEQAVAAAERATPDVVCCTRTWKRCSSILRASASSAPSASLEQSIKTAAAPSSPGP